MEQERNIISVEPLEGGEGKWRRWAIFRSEDLACYCHQNGWSTWAAALAECLCCLTNQKKIGCDVTVCPHHQELGMS
jgi:hypothetical protein